MGRKLETVTVADLGARERSSPPRTTRPLSTGQGQEKEIKGRIDEIKAQIDKTTSDYDKEKLRSAWRSWPAAWRSSASVQPPKPN